jgi:uncharacterized protein YjbI with pentapeptide repeats
MQGASFHNADLEGATFVAADLRGVDFSGAHLGNADLARADASYADFRGAGLDGASMAGTCLHGAKLLVGMCEKIRFSRPGLDFLEEDQAVFTELTELCADWEDCPIADRERLRGEFAALGARLVNAKELGDWQKRYR